MDADHRGITRPILADDEVRVSKAREEVYNKASHRSESAVKVILSLQFLEVTAFFGVYLSLIVYLQDVLHGDSASNVATVSSWAAASYLMPVLGAAVADSYWGKYKTVLVGLTISVLVSDPLHCSCSTVSSTAADTSRDLDPVRLQLLQLMLLKN